jgi:hypothetical protein
MSGGRLAAGEVLAPSHSERLNTEGTNVHTVR